MINYVTITADPAAKCLVCLDLFDDVEEVVAHEPANTWVGAIYRRFVVVPNASMHPIHRKCLYRWSTVSNTCPVCRRKFRIYTVNKTECVKNVVGIALPMICGMAACLGIYSLLAGMTMKTDITTLIVDYGNALRSQLSQLPIDQQTADALLKLNMEELAKRINRSVLANYIRSLAFVSQCVPITLRGISWLSNKLLNIDLHLPHHVYMSLLVLIGAISSARFIENLTFYTLVELFVEYTAG